MAKLRSRSVKIAIDVLLLVGFLAEFITREGPDYQIHSWIGIILVPVITIHLASNLAWVRRVVNQGRNDREFSLAVLNGTLGLFVVVCLVTGFPIWLEWSEASAWAGIHTITGFVSILLMFVHLFRNRRRIGRLLARSTPAI